MKPDEMLSIATKLRKQGARKLELRADGSMVVEFIGLPAVSSRARAKLAVASEQTELDAILRDPRLTDAQREQIEDRLNAEYIPGGGL